MIFIKENFDQITMCTWGSRAYSTDSYPTGCSVVPVVTYENADLHKLCIVKDNAGKTGIYRCASPKQRK